MTTCGFVMPSVPPYVSVEVSEGCFFRISSHGFAGSWTWHFLGYIALFPNSSFELSPWDFTCNLLKV